MEDVLVSYYTERHGMRVPVEQTETISLEMYTLLFDCCTKYFDNIAWKYPAECPDGNGCCGLDHEKFNAAMTFEIPTLFKNSNGVIDKPHKDYYGNDDAYDQYALLDLIELIANEARDISNRFWHGFFRHDDLSFAGTNSVTKTFKTEINGIFVKTGLLFTLSKSGMVERANHNSPLSESTEACVSHIPEKGVKELLENAIMLYKTPNPACRRDSVEKIRDALERLKTYYTTLDKKNSVAKIVNDMADGRTEYVTIFNDELFALTKIGNNFRIRHHETDKTDIIDQRHYDYFFNRCLSLIALAIQYLH